MGSLRVVRNRIIELNEDIEELNEELDLEMSRDGNSEYITGLRGRIKSAREMRIFNHGLLKFIEGE